ncbi:unnamed protein product, partial [Meganyctiphanes norvegica]
ILMAKGLVNSTDYVSNIHSTHVGTAIIMTPIECNGDPPPSYEDSVRVITESEGNVAVEYTNPRSNAGPPPTYEDCQDTNAPPPTYESLFGQLPEAKKVVQGFFDFFFQKLIFLIFIIAFIVSHNMIVRILMVVCIVLFILYNLYTLRENLK